LNFNKTKKWASRYHCAICIAYSYTSVDEVNNILKKRKCNLSCYILMADKHLTWRLSQGLNTLVWNHIFLYGSYTNML